MGEEPKLLYDWLYKYSREFREFVEENKDLGVSEMIEKYHLDTKQWHGFGTALRKCLFY